MEPVQPGSRQCRPDPYYHGCTAETVAITLNNDDKTTPFLAQSWVTDADGVRTDALIALPPLQRIDAGQKSQVRITQVRGLTDKLPQDRETLFWFNVRGVPRSQKTTTSCNWPCRAS